MSKPQSVCLYSELETYSGSISHHPSDLPRLIWELKLACLFYDVVMLHRRNLWEHPLTLPAFEKLAPFVKKGVLWTSADEDEPPPVKFVTQKVEHKLAEFSSKKHKQNLFFNEALERWQHITPLGDWKIRRCASEQAASVLAHLDSELSKFKDNKFRQVHSLLDLVQRMRADNDFDKEKTLARVGTLRGLFHPALLSEIATLIQTEFVRAGADFNNNAVIYPGKSAQCLTNPNFDPLPFAHSTLHKVKERFKNVGFNLNELIELPASVLFEIAQSEEWLNIRNALLNDTFDIEIQQEMRSVFSTNDSFPSKLGTLLKISGYWSQDEDYFSAFTPSPIILPSPWALVSQSLLGNASARVAAEKEMKTVSKTFILDLDSRVLYEEKSPHSQVELSQQQTNLLSILVIAGKSGLTLELMKQWLMELDILKEEDLEWESQIKLNPPESDEKFFQLRNRLEWKSQAELNPENDEKFFQLRNRIDGLKRDIKKKLKPLGLRIGGEKGKERWYLETDNSEQDFIIKLSNTVWGEIFEKKDMKEPPKGLSPQSKLIWNYLRNSSGFVHAKALAEILKKDWNEKTQQQIYDAIYKLKQQLKNKPWMIRRSSTGEYALVSRQNSNK
ncbi:MAG: hypothetical protein DRR19_14295 [Candidatus Parabeggiatoa sp. nov. 1]|nr:MAG: hypothetical protein DRR19_14295 [Gammaproteobacteria bacterium]